MNIFLRLIAISGVLIAPFASSFAVETCGLRGDFDKTYGKMAVPIKILSKAIGERTTVLTAGNTAYVDCKQGESVLVIAAKPYCPATGLSESPYQHNYVAAQVLMSTKNPASIRVSGGGYWSPELPAPDKEC